MKITDERVLFEGPWISLKERDYIDTQNNSRSWSFIERRNKQKAAVIVPITQESGSLIIIQQYRIPFMKNLYEFPAGLIDPGETPEQAAVRELAEETGYQGVIDFISPEIASSSGLASETVHMVYMTVKEGPSYRPRHEDSEQITIHKLFPNTIQDFLRKCEKTDKLLDAKLSIYLRERLRYTTGSMSK